MFSDNLLTLSHSDILTSSLFNTSIMLSIFLPPKKNICVISKQKKIQQVGGV